MEPFRIIRGAVPRQYTDALLRRMWLEIVSRGVTSNEVHDWSRTTWFPWLRDSPEVEAIGRFVVAWVGPEPGDRWAEPQLLMRFPDWPDSDWRMTPHVDQLPPWAAPHERYRAIIGVALTDSTVAGGCLHVFPDGRKASVPLATGDAVIVAPDVPHSGGLNTTAHVRAVVYFRLLTRRAVSDK